MMTPADQTQLFEVPLGISVTRDPDHCKIVTIGRRRDGGTKYWCIEHFADATAKYGLPADSCRYAHVPRPKAEETLELDETSYAGGVALWGAVPPVYDTTRQPLDRGIHVHARSLTGAKKSIDQTYKKVLFKSKLHGSIEVSELDAIYFMVSSVMGLKMRYVECRLCGHPHLDRDWFSVHAHGKHLCATCGRTFHDSCSAVGNPLAKLAMPARSIRKAKESLRIRQADYPFGIQIWGSNPAIIWTGDEPEESGIHVHAHAAEICTGVEPVIDGTYSSVVIDGVRLDPIQVRTYMAQSALPHLVFRIVAASCTACSRVYFDKGSAAFIPSILKNCVECGGALNSRSRLRNVISNPLVQQLDVLAEKSPTPRVIHDLGLIPEKP